MLASLLTTFLWAASAAFATRSSRLIGGTEANFWRLSFGLLPLALYAHYWGQGLGGASFPLFFASGIVGLGGDVFLFQSLPRLGARLSMVLVLCGAAVWGAVIEWLWLGTTLTVPQMSACATILFGIILALAPGGHLKITQRELGWGIFFGTLAGLGNAGGAVLSRKANAIAVLSHQNIDAPTAAYQRVVGGLLVAGVCLLAVKRRHIVGQFTESDPPRLPEREKWRRVWPWIAGNSLCGQVLGITCYQWALKTTPTAIVLAIIAATPIVVMPLSYILEGERPGPRSVLGGTIAVGGVVALVLMK